MEANVVRRLDVSTNIARNAEEHVTRDSSQSGPGATRVDLVLDGVADASRIAIESAAAEVAKGTSLLTQTATQLLPGVFTSSARPQRRIGTRQRSA
eukprot:6887369-Prymnesium_polylepis.2